VWIAVLGLMLAPAPPARTAPAAAELTKLLEDFLAGASRNDAAVHDAFHQAPWRAVALHASRP
jgi:hypothetical protein